MIVNSDLCLKNSFMRTVTFMLFFGWFHCGWGWLCIFWLLGLSVLRQIDLRFLIFIFCVCFLLWALNFHIVQTKKPYELQFGNAINHLPCVRLADRISLEISTWLTILAEDEGILLMNGRDACCIACLLLNRSYPKGCKRAEILGAAKVNHTGLCTAHFTLDLLLLYLNKSSHFF